MFWKNLAPPKDCAPPEGELLTMIERDFGSLAALQEKFSAQTVAVQGSGWGWLGYNKATGKLAIATTANQVRSKRLVSDVERESIAFFSFLFDYICVLS